MKYKNCGNKNNNLEIDMKELALLNKQLIGSIFIFMSDIIVYFSLSKIIEIISSSENNIDDYLLLIIQGEIYAVISRLLFFDVDFIRYHNLYERYENGEIDYSLEPNVDSIIADIYGLMNYVYAYLASVAIYNRNQVISAEDEGILNLQIQATLIHLLSDIFLIETTLESIQLIKNKYENEKVPIENPDIAAINFAILNHISRIIYVNLAFKAYEIVYDTLKSQGAEELLIGNVYLIVSSISSIAASYYTIIAVYGIYERHIVQPVFAL